MRCSNVRILYANTDPSPEPNLTVLCKSNLAIQHSNIPLLQTVATVT